MPAKPIFLVLLCALLVLTAGCNGDGVFIGTHKSIDGGDVPDDNSDDNDNESPDPIPPDVTNLGTWITAYGDDKVDSAAANGVQEHAAVVTLTRTDSVLSGTGTVYRVFEYGSLAADKLSIKLSGTISGDNATVSVTSATGGTVSDMPTWRLRFAGRYLVGAYRSVNSSNNQVRSGHALWRKVSSCNLNGSWVSAYSDARGTAAMPARDRTAAMVLTHGSGDATFTGTGTIVEQVPGTDCSEYSFNVVRSAVSSSEVGYTLGDLDMASNEIDWFGLATSGVIVNAFAQYDLADKLIRAGHGRWYYAPDATPNAVSAIWITAFSDAGYATGLDPSCYLFSMKLEPEEGNVVSGSGEVVDAGFDITTAQTVQVQNGTMVGSRVTLETRVPVTGDVFSWELRVAGNLMVGSYQRRDASGAYISSGTAEWRKQLAAPSPKGAWATSYCDTVNSDDDPLTQFVLVSVTSQAQDGTLSGNGALRYMNGETGRRLFNLVSSSVSNQIVTWVWRGTDLFGDTTWRLRHAGDYMFGVYENLTSAGNLESLGTAVWIRVSDSGSL